MTTHSNRTEHPPTDQEPDAAAAAGHEAPGVSLLMATVFGVTPMLAFWMPVILGPLEAREGGKPHVMDLLQLPPLNMATSLIDYGWVALLLGCLMARATWLPSIHEMARAGLAARLGSLALALLAIALLPWDAITSGGLSWGRFMIGSCLLMLAVATPFHVGLLRWEHRRAPDADAS